MPHVLSVDQILEDESLDISTIRHIRRDPLVLSGMFTELTRQLYSEEAHMLHKAKTWSPTNEENHVFIEPAHIFDDSDVSRRPAIFIDVGDLTYSSERTTGIGDISGLSLRDGTQDHYRLVTGSVIWAHIGRSRGEVLSFGGTTLDLMDGFSFVIRKDFCFDRFGIRVIFKPRQRKDKPLEWECLVQADYQFQETFQLKLESPKLKQISLRPNIGIDPEQGFNFVQ